MKLWEAEHSYYCSETNYFSNDCEEHFMSWSEFAAEYASVVLDWNLLFRWDWEVPSDDIGEPLPMNPDPYYRDCTLHLFWIGQRKGLFRSTTVSVCAADEPAVREWLRKPFEHLKALWAPLEESP
jgi:hypothetical protein